jgi:hypothetical protein
MGFPTPEQAANAQIRQWQEDWYAAHPETWKPIAACRDMFEPVTEALDKATMIAMEDGGSATPMLFAALLHAHAALTALVALVEAQGGAK